MPKPLREKLAKLTPERRARIEAEADQLQRELQAHAKPCEDNKAQG